MIRMFVRSETLLVSTILCTILTFPSTIKSQQSSSTSSKPTGVTSSEARDNPSSDQKPESSPAPSPEPDFWHEETITGDWGGKRERWREHGLDIQFTLAQFVQGTVSGGLRRDSEWNTKFESDFNLDFEKLWG